MSLPLSEAIVVALVVVLLAIYHVHLIREVRRRPARTSYGIMNHTRRAWVESMVEKKCDIVAVQTLRNWIMASSFLASTAILLSLGMLHLVFQADLFGRSGDSAGALRIHDLGPWNFKWFLAAVMFFLAFFNFTLSIRYHNHVGFMINVTADKDRRITVDYVAGVLNRGALHHFLGMRAFYLSVPFVLWLFGPVSMLGGTILLLVILYTLDRSG